MDEPFLSRFMCVVFSPLFLATTLSPHTKCNNKSEDEANYDKDSLIKSISCDMIGRALQPGKTHLLKRGLRSVVTGTDEQPVRMCITGGGLAGNATSMLKKKVFYIYKHAPHTLLC
jgi:hypothetical protein